MNLTAIIVDDEARGRRTLRHLIEEYCPNIEVVATCEDVLSGVKAINQFNPKIVFLDIEMPNYSGFKLIEYFDEKTFEVIFTTAYEKHAIRAFKTSAIGYLLKPISIDELIEVVDKVKNIHGPKSIAKSKSISNINSTRETPNRLALNSSSGILYLQLKEILYLESDGKTTKIHLNNGQQLISTNSLKECHQMLEKTLFQKVHRSFIVNLAYLKKYSRGRNSYVILESGHQLDVGINFKDELNKVTSLFEK